MANKTKKKLTRKTSEAKTKKIQIDQVNKGFFAKLKFTESYTSLILGAIVVLIIGILFISFAKINRSMQTSSTNNFAKVEDLNLPDSNTSSTYTVKAGDDLWSISEDIFNDGYKWVEIAKLNKIENPEDIEVGKKLVLPTVDQKEELAVEGEIQDEAKTVFVSSIIGDSYTVVKGDNLWNISVRAYGDGFRWIDIARANKLVNPDLIHPGNHFIIPR